jgi:hypothetical protein
MERDHQEDLDVGNGIGAEKADSGVDFSYSGSCILPLN